MKNVMKILAVLLCAFTVFALAACGEKDENKDKQSKADTSTVSDTESGDGESQTGDGIILPEDGKITFGKDDKKSGDTKETETDKSGKDESAKPSGSTAGGNSSKTEKTSDSSGDTSSKTTGTGSGNDYGGIQWNK